MKNNVAAYYQLILSDLTNVKIYNDEKDSFEEYFFVKDSSLKTFKIFFFKNHKIVKKELSLDKIEQELLKEYNHKMVVILSKDNKKDIYSVISRVSKYRGVCAPVIELEDQILYFPKLRYSDMGLLRYIYKQRKKGHYRLLMISGY